MEDWLAIRESFSARSCIPKKELSCGGSKTQSEGMSKIAVLWFGPGKNLLHFCGSPLHPFPYAQRHPSSCGDPLDLGFGLRSTPLDGRQQRISEPGMMSSWFLPPVCFVVRERSRAMWNLGSFTGKGGHTLKERTDKPTFPEVTCLFVSKDTCPALFWNWWSHLSC